MSPTRRLVPAAQWHLAQEERRDQAKHDEQRADEKDVGDALGQGEADRRHQLAEERVASGTVGGEALLYACDGVLREQQLWVLERAELACRDAMGERGRQRCLEV